MKELCIVGAGLSGLYLASLLQEHYKVTILEAKKRIGGRVLTKSGHDLGPSWVWPHQSNILNLLDELDIPIFRQYVKGDALYQANNQVQRFNPPPSPVSMRIDGGIDTLIQKLHAKLDKTTIHLDTKIDSITQIEDSIELCSASQSFHADIVIITAPPRVALKIDYMPKLDTSTKAKLQSIPTWMGHSRKVVVTYEKAFWRELGLSGFVFSHEGPCSEIHDASTSKEAALFAFIRGAINHEDIEHEVITQLVTLFGEMAKEYHAFYDKNWRKDRFISTKEDWSLRTHPDYGHTSHSMDTNLYFLSTEAAYQQGGYLDGAINAAQKLYQKLV